MTEPVKLSPGPRYSRRRTRARATRARVLEAARELFEERGFGATTIDAIASRGDVSVETIYATFGNKRSILAELVDIAVAGGVDAAPVLDQDWVGALGQERDLRLRIRMLAANGRAILARRSAVDEIVRGAATADPEIAVLRDLGKAQRYAGQRNLLRLVAGEDGFRTGLKLSVAADVLYAIGSPETFRLLVIERGWSAARFERWYADAIGRLLFDLPDVGLARRASPRP